MSLETWCQRRGVQITHARPSYAAGEWGLMRWSAVQYDGIWECTAAIAGVGQEVATGHTPEIALHRATRMIIAQLAVVIPRLTQQAQLMEGVAPMPSPPHLRVLRTMAGLGLDQRTCRTVGSLTGYSHQHSHRLMTELEQQGLINDRVLTTQGEALLKMMEVDR